MSDTSTARLPMTITVELSPDKIAEAFCELDDDAQAQFFVSMARIMRSWKTPAGWTVQAWNIGRHLATCTCVTEDAREVVREIACGLGGAK
jgi:hypothetical protein